MSELPPGEYIVVGGDVDRVSVSIRVAGDDLDPDEVTSTLLVQPSFSARKGDRHTSSGREIMQRTGIWVFNFSGSAEEWTLGDAIGALLDRLPSDLRIWQSLASKYRLDVFCGVYIEVWNRGFQLPPALMRRLADRGLSLGIDVYCDGSDDEAT